ncbi:MAG: AraC family transcriptional regulator [Bacteroidales bacterium]|nr:AraC family transcriptional regulator [Bacteroidales bacterium]
MKAFFEQLTSDNESSIRVIDLNMNTFDGPYHYHPELELTWIRKGSGKRVIGGSVSDFEEDDLVLVGANVPHCWQSNTDVVSGYAQAIVFQFLPDFAGASFLGLPELNRIQNLLNRSFAGILVKGTEKGRIISKMRQCTSADGFGRLIHFIGILDLIANSDDSELIDYKYIGKVQSSADSERFQKVFSFLIQNYQNEISLETIAEVANLTPTAFCRYFKKVTRKTLVEIVTEFRINQACQLLGNSEKPVSDICFECGFGNISYFNKTFKAITGNTPLQYRRLFLNQGLNMPAM